MASRNLESSTRQRSSQQTQGQTLSSQTRRTQLGGKSKNVSPSGRWLSTLAGGALILRGMSGRGTSSNLLAALGAYLAYRGATGHCPISASLAPSGPRENWAVSRDQGIQVEESVVVQGSPESLYKFWRNFENLPRFMNHLESVITLGGDRSRWVAKAPLGQTVEWEAEVVGDQTNELISWRSLPGSDVPNAGSVRFKPAGSGATRVEVSLKYNPPAGALGAAVAKLFGEEPSQQIADDLSRFKRLMESGGAAGASGTTGATGTTGAWASGTTTSAQGAAKTGLTSSANQSDEVGEASEESFPASDPPAFTGSRASGKREGES